MNAFHISSALLQCKTVAFWKIGVGVYYVRNRESFNPHQLDGKLLIKDKFVGGKGRTER